MLNILQSQSMDYINSLIEFWNIMNTVHNFPSHVGDCHRISFVRDEGRFKIQDRNRECTVNFVNRETPCVFICYSICRQD